MNSFVNEYLAVAQVRRLEEGARRRHGERHPPYGRRRHERLKRAASLAR